MLGDDPNFRPGVFLKLSGVAERIARFTLEVLDEKLETVFTREYENLEVTRHSLLEFYTGPERKGSMLRLRLDDFEKTIDLKSVA